MMKWIKDEEDEEGKREIMLRLSDNCEGREEREGVMERKTDSREEERKEKKEKEGERDNP